MLVVLVVSERSQCLPYNAERQARSFYILWDTYTPLNYLFPMKDLCVKRNASDKLQKLEFHFCYFCIPDGKVNAALD